MRQDECKLCKWIFYDVAACMFVCVQCVHSIQTALHKCVGLKSHIRRNKFFNSLSSHHFAKRFKTTERYGKNRMSAGFLN